LFGQEGIFLEPSATAGFPGYYLTQQNKEYITRFSSESLVNSVHIVWATGGSMVPPEEREKYLG
jgi:D-serine dehydratase